METTEPSANADLVGLSGAIVSAYVSHNALSPGALPELLKDVHTALVGLGSQASLAKAEAPNPAVPVRRSITPGHLVCLEDGKKFKSLKRHLMTHHGLTPEQYRQKWALPLDYPMVAPQYSATRSALAKSSGLGRAGASPVPTPRRKR